MKIKHWHCQCRYFFFSLYFGKLPFLDGSALSINLWKPIKLFHKNTNEQYITLAQSGHKAGRIKNIKGQGSSDTGHWSRSRVGRPGSVSPVRVSAPCSAAVVRRPGGQQQEHNITSLRPRHREHLHYLHTISTAYLHHNHSACIVNIYLYSISVYIHIYLGLRHIDCIIFCIFFPVIIYTRLKNVNYQYCNNIRKAEGNRIVERD